MPDGSIDATQSPNNVLDPLSSRILGEGERGAEGRHRRRGRAMEYRHSPRKPSGQPADFAATLVFYNPRRPGTADRGATPGRTDA